MKLCCVPPTPLVKKGSVLPSTWPTRAITVRRYSPGLWMVFAGTLLLVLVPSSTSASAWW